MDQLSDSSAIFQYHRDMAKMHGSDSTYALGWRDKHSQQVRFDILAEIGDLNNCSVLDAGCGYGGLLHFLLDKYQAVRSYTGTDFIPEMIEKAISDSPEISTAQFLAANFITWPLPVFDYVFASGSLNYGSSDATYIYKAITRLYSLCTIGLGFNLLQKINGAGIIAAYPIDDIVGFCKTLSPDVKMITGYDEEDFTIFIYRT